MLKKLLVGIVAFVASIGMALAAVNINTATQAELETLKGVGPAKAKAIMEYRAKNGNFKTIDDIKKVKGIGDKTFDKLKADLSVNGASATKTAVPAAKPAAAPAAPAKK